MLGINGYVKGFTGLSELGDDTFDEEERKQSKSKNTILLLK